MMKLIKEWWPVVSLLLDIVFFIVVLVFMLLAMAHGRWDEAVFWLLLRLAHTMQGIKDKL